MSLLTLAFRKMLASPNDLYTTCNLSCCGSYVHFRFVQHHLLHVPSIAGHLGPSACFHWNYHFGSQPREWSAPFPGLCMLPFANVVATVLQETVQAHRIAISCPDLPGGPFVFVSMLFCPEG